jgi:hypothetical protein
MLPDGNHWQRRHGLNSFLLLAWPVLFNLFGGASAHANLVIKATFDSTITSDPNAAVIESTINSVIALYEASFSDPITVTITFHETTDALGYSSTYYIPGFLYSTFRASLAAGATTANDTNALAHLPAGSSNPVNGSATIELNLPNGRALGFTESYWNPPGTNPDGDIYLMTSAMNLTRASINPSKFDLFAVTAHEIDEVLGLSSKLDGLANGAPAPTGDVGVMDLFRYNQNGNRSFNTTSSSQAWFSLDGTTQLVRFNQTAPGDFHDWYSPGGQTPRVQDASAMPGATPNPTVELIALDVIGYHPVPALAIARAGNGSETISWSPNPPGFVLQESTNLVSANWLNSASGTNNPATITNTTRIKFFRLFHP